MKITDIKAYSMQMPLAETPPFSAYPDRKEPHILVEVTTDEDITGYGEAIQFTHGSITGYIEKQLKPYLIGENPLHIDRLWDKIYRQSDGYGIRGISMHILSAVEVALWDILGKKHGAPIYEMLGGLSHEKMKAYASLMVYKTPKDAADAALKWIEQGYTALKLHQGRKNAVEVTKVVRDAVGDSADIMLDVNGAWSRNEAIKHAKTLERLDLAWLEEPIWPIDDYESIAYLKEKTSIPIAIGENEQTHYGFKELITKNAADIVQPDPIMAGGINSCKKIMALAEAWNLDIAVHSWAFGPGFPAAVHLSLSNVNCEWVEVRAMPLCEYYMVPEFKPKNGYISALSGPGLGIEIDWDVVKKYTV